MESQIWRVRTEKIGSLEKFSSERHMEAFLMNNPAIVGCWDPESDVALPSLIRSQIITQTSSRQSGRMDLVGISKIEDHFELRIFELKNEDIGTEAVKQLAWYLETWNKDYRVRSNIKEWIVDLDLDGVDDSNVDKIVNKPVGVLVGPKFLPDGISKAIECKIQCVRIARFRSETASEYFVIIEDQVGTIVETGKRQNWAWINLIEGNLIEASDLFSLFHKGIKLSARPDPKYLDYMWKWLIYEEDSRKKLLEKEATIRNNAGSYKSEWLDKDFDAIKKGEGLVITRASALFYFAFGGPYASVYWSPTSWWTHEKSGRPLIDLVNEYFSIKA